MADANADTEEWEGAVDERTLATAIAAYEAVWQSYTPLDAKTVNRCRRKAMTAALLAVGVSGEAPATLSNPEALPVGPIAP